LTPENQKGCSKIFKGTSKEKLGKIETDNLVLASKLGVTTFEKNQVVKMGQSGFLKENIIN
jgi:hypothetical protein